MEFPDELAAQNERAVKAQERIAIALESLAETARLQHEVSIDAIAKNNALSDDLGSALTSLTSGFFGNEDDPEDS